MGCSGLKLKKNRAFEFLILHVHMEKVLSWIEHLKLYLQSLYAEKKIGFFSFAQNFLNVLKDTVGWLLSLVFVLIVKF